MARRRYSKKKAIRQHARRRMVERFGMVLTEEGRQEIIRRIQENKGKFIEKQSNRVSVWELEVGGQLAHICYDKTRKDILSIWEAPNGQTA